jgi:hypothetical protein
MTIAVGTEFEVRFVHRRKGVVAHSTVIEEVWRKARIVRWTSSRRWEFVLLSASGQPEPWNCYRATPAWFESTKNVRFAKEVA